MPQKQNLEQYFGRFREKIIGIDTEFVSPYGKKKIIYADWVASGRLYADIEQTITNTFGPFVGNTHTETSETGSRMTRAYHYAQSIIKTHVNAAPTDVIISAGYGMTSVINKLIRILGLKICGKLQSNNCLAQVEKPVVFITHMEHHSNHTPWLETFADVVIIEPGSNLQIDLDNFEKLLIEHSNRKFKIGSFTACSNVTGVHTPYHKMAALMHKYGGLAFVDFAASAPYQNIDMHPQNPDERLDAIFFSPHKFIGGPGAAGIMVFNSSIYHNPVPDQPGGGTVDWTNPWNKYKYVDNIETREDGGTPGFLQTIKAALAIKLKEKMGTDNIIARENELLNLAFSLLRQVNGIHILADNMLHRLGILSFYIDNIHFNLVVKLLNDRFGIQMRGGCACAGTYGHYLLQVTYEKSMAITDKINHGDLSEKPGWVRWSLHPTTTNNEVLFIIDAINQISNNYLAWQTDYVYNKHTNEFVYKNNNYTNFNVATWFKM